MKATALPETELKRNLQSLACAKYKILKKHPPSRDVRPDDSFSFNEDFSAPLQKLKIAVVSARVEGQEERQETNDRIDEERKHQIEVCHFFWQLSTKLNVQSQLGLHSEDYEEQEAYVP